MIKIVWIKSLNKACNNCFVLKGPKITKDNNREVGNRNQKKAEINQNLINPILLNGFFLYFA